MDNRTFADHDLESLRRSLAMLQTNQLALTRDQGIALVTHVIDLRQQVRRLDARQTGAPPVARPDGARRA